MKRRFAGIMAIAMVLAGCSGGQKPPEGRWEGVYQNQGTLIAARLEIERDGTVRVSAPNAANVADADAQARMRQSLATELAAEWADVEPRKMDFDGHVFRKPGGIAPQMVWDAKAKKMTLILYFGTQPSIRLPVHAVSDFSENPFLAG